MSLHGHADSKRLSILVVGMSLGLLLSISFVLCIALAFFVPDWGLHKPWLQFLILPGFLWMTWPSFFLGLCESFAYGLYIAVVFVPLYNFFNRIGEDWW